LQTTRAAITMPSRSEESQREAQGHCHPVAQSAARPDGVELSTMIRTFEIAPAFGKFAMRAHLRRPSREHLGCQPILEKARRAIPHAPRGAAFPCGPFSCKAGLERRFALDEHPRILQRRQILLSGFRYRPVPIYRVQSMDSRWGIQNEEPRNTLNTRKRQTDDQSGT
jgi:hypothetical protein